MKELKKAVVKIWDRKEDVVHIILFEDHNDAVDVMVQLKHQTRFNFEEMISPEVYKQGEKPEWLPLQKPLI
jgi:hypothetical protein